MGNRSGGPVRRTIRPGARLLLGIALVVGTLGSVWAAARIADVVLDLLGVVRAAVRLGIKGIAMAAAVPAGFYVVERAFLAWTATPRKRPGP